MATKKRKSKAPPKIGYKTPYEFFSFLKGMKLDLKRRKDLPRRIRIFE
jgi:hypothetical protein